MNLFTVLQSHFKPLELDVKVLFSTLLALVILLSSTKLMATQPYAEVASCAGIRQAYPVLGAKCIKQYEKIEYAPASEQQRKETFKARKLVTITLRKALLCNEFYSASIAAQHQFKSSEAGHLTALDYLRNRMKNLQDSNLYQYQLPDLSAVSIKKQQCN